MSSVRSMHVLKTLFSILSRGQKREMKWLLCLLMLSAVLEVAGVALLGPLMSSALDVGSSTSNELFSIIGLKSKAEIISLLGVTCIAVY